MAIVIRGVDHPSLTDDEDVVVLILGAAETEALTKVMDALDRLSTRHVIGPMVAAHQGWPSLASLRDGLVSVPALPVGVQEEIDDFVVHAVIDAEVGDGNA